LNNKGQLTATASPAQPRRPEILRLATATAFYSGGGNFLRLATAYELYGGLRRQLGGLVFVSVWHESQLLHIEILYGDPGAPGPFPSQLTSWTFSAFNDLPTPDITPDIFQDITHSSLCPPWADCRSNCTLRGSCMYECHFKLTLSTFTKARGSHTHQYAQNPLQHTVLHVGNILGLPGNLFSRSMVVMVQYDLFHTIFRA